MMLFSSEKHRAHSQVLIEVLLDIMEEYYANNLEGYYNNLQMGLPVLYYEGRNNPPHLENWIEYFIRIMRLNAENIARQAQEATKGEQDKFKVDNLIEPLITKVTRFLSKRLY